MWILTINIAPWKHTPACYLHGNHSNSIFMTPVIEREVNAIITKIFKKTQRCWDEFSWANGRDSMLYYKPLACLFNISLTRSVLSPELKRANVRTATLVILLTDKWIIHILPMLIRIGVMWRILLWEIEYLAMTVFTFLNVNTNHSCWITIPDETPLFLTDIA